MSVKDMLAMTGVVVVLGIDRRGENEDVLRYIELNDPAYTRQEDGSFKQDETLRAVRTLTASLFADTPEGAVFARLQWDADFYRRAHECVLANLESAKTR